MFLMAFTWAINLSIEPYILKIILDRVTHASSNSVFQSLLAPIGAYLFMSFLMTAMQRVYGYFVEINMIPKLRLKISQFSFDILLAQSHSYYQNQFVGGLSNKVNDLTSSIPEMIQIIVDQFFSRSLALAIAIFTLGWVNIKFALLMLVWATIFMSACFFLSKRLSFLSDSWSEHVSIITGKLVDALSNISSIRLYSRKKEEKFLFFHIFQKGVRAEQKLEWLYFWVWFFYGYSFITMQGINLYLLVKGSQQGQFSVGDFALVLSINAAIADFLWQLMMDFTKFSKLLGKITQALRTLLLIPEIQDKLDAKNLFVSKGKITFDKVWFHYKGTSPLFKSQSETIFSGEKVGLVGYSGSGKTTFVNLILRFFDVTSGKILIDNQDIRNITQDSLHKNIGMIPQDPSLFHRTLRENIRYGKLEATNKEIIEAAKKAHAHDFIMALPEGYNSLVGERGVKLSGGQRQRITIARAILKNAPILILDEATSQLDSITENYVQESLWKLMQGKTVLVIAHRLSTLLHMDRILVFDKGRIIEKGTHEELLKKKSLYKTLWDAQIGGYLGDINFNET